MSLAETDCIYPIWSAPSHVKALFTTRAGGISVGALASLNLGRSVGDDSAAVDENRRRLSVLLGGAPRWMNQVHGVGVAALDEVPPTVPITADAALSRQAKVYCTVTTADCLPVLFSDVDGTLVAAAHAGWRGLAAGVLEQTVSAMHVSGSSVVVFLGPAIGPRAFEVGADVRDVFLANAMPSDRTATEEAFTALPNNIAEKWLADLYALARIRLRRVGVLDPNIAGGTYCTFSDETRFFSHRRESSRGKRSGRMAAVIWRE
jgi:polyphenol oxidase